MSSADWRPFCSYLNVLTLCSPGLPIMTSSHNGTYNLRAAFVLGSLILLIGVIGIYVQMTMLPQKLDFIDKSSVGFWTGIIVSKMGMLNYCDRVTHICISKVNIIVSDNGSSPGRHQTTIWISAGILINEHLGTNCSEIFIEFHTISLKNAFENVVCEIAAILSRPHVWCISENFCQYHACWCLGVLASPVPVLFK